MHLVILAAGMNKIIKDIHAASMNFIKEMS